MKNKITVVIVVGASSEYGFSWGKGRTLTEAVKNYPEKLTGKINLLIYQAEDINEIYVNEFGECHRGINDKLLYRGIEELNIKTL